MTVKELKEINNKIKNISDYIFDLYENENNTIEDKIELLLLNTEINIIDGKIIKLMKDRLEK